MSEQELKTPYVPNKETLIATRKRADGALIQETADSVLETRLVEIKGQNSSMATTMAALNTTMGQVLAAQTASNQGMAALGSKIDALKASEDAVKASVDALQITMAAQLAATQAQTDKPRSASTASSLTGSAATLVDAQTGANLTGGANGIYIHSLLVKSTSLIAGLLGAPADLTLFYTDGVNGVAHASSVKVLPFSMTANTMIVIPNVFLMVPAGKTVRVQANSTGISVTAITRPV